MRTGSNSGSPDIYITWPITLQANQVTPTMTAQLSSPKGAIKSVIVAGIDEGKPGSRSLNYENIEKCKIS